MPNAAQEAPAELTDIVANAVALVESDQKGDIQRVLSAIKRDEDAGEVLDDVAADMKSYFGSLAANSVTDGQAEEAIASVDQWITNNISNGTMRERVTGALTMRSADDLIASL